MMENSFDNLVLWVKLLEKEVMYGKLCL